MIELSCDCLVHLGCAFVSQGELLSFCEKRAKHGFDSGMGAIFHYLASITPIHGCRALPPVSSALILGCELHALLCSLRCPANEGQHPHLRPSHRFRASMTSTASTVPGEPAVPVLGNSNAILSSVLCLRVGAMSSRILLRRSYCASRKSLCVHRGFSMHCSKVCGTDACGGFRPTRTRFNHA